MRKLEKIKFKKNETKIIYNGKRFETEKDFIKQVIKYFQNWMNEYEKTN